ncbi:putative cytochrome oxidase [Rhypophila decipiens]|uniref:Cytochrome oxidase n=1 Tax=Rhypophila decipiens TaxID=261697 RepID=A0AAN7B807_9PEZI|nr:putative cytochrome oxidase [Rhypophila decipiens]
MLSRIATKRGDALQNTSPLLRRRIVAATAIPSRTQLQQRRGLISAPKPGDGPLMERRPDRELPNVEKTRFRWSRTLPIFFVLVAAASVAIFNYQKSSSSVVTSTLYALRTSPKAREYLGDEIYFLQQIPWISGEMNQLHGRINIAFRVKGTKGTAIMRFASHRPGPRAMFETTEWSLETSDGRMIDLLEGGDPFRGIVGADVDVDDEDEVEVKRGFRK